MDEQERWRLKLDSVWKAWLADPTYHAHRTQVAQARAERGAEGLRLLEDLRETRDTEAFRTAMQAWSQLSGYSSFKGFGMMFLHQIVNYTDDGELATSVLLDALTAPESVDDAAGKIRRLVAHVDKIKKGGQPAPGRVPLVVSLFWSMSAEDEWPCLWRSADKVLTTLGWLTPPGELDEWYLSYRTIALASGLSAFDFESILWWMNETKPFTGLDPSMLDRCVENVALADEWRSNGNAYPTPEAARTAERNARAIVGEIRLVGDQLEERVGNALGRSVTSRVANRKYYADCYRADAYVTWMTGPDSKSSSIWLWVTDTGVAVGLHPGWREKGWTNRIAHEIDGHIPAGLELLRFYSQIGNRIVSAANEADGGSFLVGRFFPGDAQLGRPEFADEIEAIAAALQPVLDRVSAAASTNAQPDTLAKLVEQFRIERGYPNETDAKALEDRQLLAATISPEALGALDVEAFRQIVNTQRYGGPGPMSALNTSLTNATADELARLAESIDYLLWDTSDSVATRIDRVSNPTDFGIKGLGESVVMKMLAIAHPDEFIPTFPFTGDHGKQRALEILGIETASLPEDAGARQVQSNRLLRDLLEPHFPNDSWGKAQFLFWLTSRDHEPSDDEIQPPILDLTAVNDELLLQPGFLDEVAQLLDEKKQVIFYGPPGTGKTYVAKRLAEALAPDAARRAIVQFHPSMSYEDFFEGYRPRTNDDGAMTYALVRGPLARMAALAEKSPSVMHVLVIDEINRANLPKVFGELLFLLEYRDETIQVLYRPDESFRLPRNLRVIGTMNTADRSIALVDAALRRRFYFVPFFPEQDQMQGMLRRWLEKNHGDVRIAALVERVNQELVADVGEHLQIGPSYFMTRGITEKDLGRIWKSSIEPFVEEQLFGQSEEIKRYRWSEVRQRFWTTLTASPDDPSILEEDTPELAVDVEEP
jgi:5-methylcytosine-specific restriction protein B